jgi:hypothetical protein
MTLLFFLDIEKLTIEMRSYPHNAAMPNSATPAAICFMVFFIATLPNHLYLSLSLSR